MVNIFTNNLRFLAVLLDSKPLSTGEIADLAGLSRVCASRTAKYLLMNRRVSRLDPDPSSGSRFYRYFLTDAQKMKYLRTLRDKLRVNGELDEVARVTELFRGIADSKSAAVRR